MSITLEQLLEKARREAQQRALTSGRPPVVTAPSVPPVEMPSVPGMLPDPGRTIADYIKAFQAPAEQPLEQPVQPAVPTSRFDRLLGTVRDMLTPAAPSGDGSLLPEPELSIEWSSTKGVDQVDTPALTFRKQSMEQEASLPDTPTSRRSLLDAYDPEIGAAYAGHGVKEPPKEYGHMMSQFAKGLWSPLPMDVPEPKTKAQAWGGLVTHTLGSMMSLPWRIGGAVGQLVAPAIKTAVQFGVSSLGRETQRVLSGEDVTAKEFIANVGVSAAAGAASDLLIPVVQRSVANTLVKHLPATLSPTIEKTIPYAIPVATGAAKGIAMGATSEIGRVIKGEPVKLGDSIKRVGLEAAIFGAVSGIAAGLGLAPKGKPLEFYRLAQTLVSEGAVSSDAEWFVIPGAPSVAFRYDPKTAEINYLFGLMVHEGQPFVYFNLEQLFEGIQTGTVLGEPGQISGALISVRVPPIGADQLSADPIGRAYKDLANISTESEGETRRLTLPSPPEQKAIEAEATPERKRAIPMGPGDLESGPPIAMGPGEIEEADLVQSLEGQKPADLAEDDVTSESDEQKPPDLKDDVTSEFSEQKPVDLAVSGSDKQKSADPEDTKKTRIFENQQATKEKWTKKERIDVVVSTLMPRPKKPGASLTPQQQALKNKLKKLLDFLEPEEGQVRSFEERATVYEFTNLVFEALDLMQTAKQKFTLLGLTEQLWNDLPDTRMFYESFGLLQRIARSPKHRHLLCEDLSETEWAEWAVRHINMWLSTTTNTAKDYYASHAPYLIATALFPEVFRVSYNSLEQGMTYQIQAPLTESILDVPLPLIEEFMSFGIIDPRKVLGFIVKARLEGTIDDKKATELERLAEEAIVSHQKQRQASRESRMRVESMAEEERKEPPDLEEETPSVDVQAETQPPLTGAGKPVLGQEFSDPTGKVKVYLAPKDIGIDAPRFQFKITGKEGVTSLLKGVTKWDEHKAGVITVWKDSDDKYWVVNGHHRLELAKRLDVESLECNVLREEDGYTASDARAAGAMQNIAEGRGTAIDAAKFFREKGLTSELLKEHGLSLRERLIEEGMALASLTDNLFGAVVRGEFPQNRAIVIGKELPNDAALQQAVLELIERHEKRGRTISAGVLEQLIRGVKSSGLGVRTQTGLFGEETFVESSALEKAELLDYVLKQLRLQRRVFGVASRSKTAKILEEAGNILATEQNKDFADQAEIAIELIGKLAHYKGTAFCELFNEAAERLRNEQNKTAVKQETLAAVLKLIKEGKALEEGWEGTKTEMAGGGQTAGTLFGAAAEGMESAQATGEEEEASVKPPEAQLGFGFGETEEQTKAPEAEVRVKSEIKPGFTPPKSLEEFKAQLKEAFPDTTTEQLDAVGAIIAGHAKYLGITADRYVQTRIAGVKVGDTPGELALYMAADDKVQEKAQRDKGVDKKKKFEPGTKVVWEPLFECYPPDGVVVHEWGKDRYKVRLSNGEDVVLYAKALKAVGKTDAPEIKKFVPPKKWVIGYKLFKFLPSKPGEARPLFIGGTKETEQGGWVPAENIPTKGYDPRPGWHAGILPDTKHLLRKDGTLDPKRRWVRVKLSADVDWQTEADKSPKGDIQGRIPEGGYYRWVRSERQGGVWLIGGAIKIDKILTEEEIKQILLENGVDVQEQTINGVPMAAVEFLEDGKALIYALEGKDISNVIHELGHIFRRSLKPADRKIAESWCGVRDGIWTDEAEEKFVRGFEEYLASGEPPNKRMSGIFAKFKQWLSEIYAELKRAKVKLTDEMKKMFARMLGAEEEAPIPAASAEQHNPKADELVRLENGQYTFPGWEGITVDEYLGTDQHRAEYYRRGDNVYRRLPSDTPASMRYYYPLHVWDSVKKTYGLVLTDERKAAHKTKTKPAPKSSRKRRKPSLIIGSGEDFLKAKIKHKPGSMRMCYKDSLEKLRKEKHGTLVHGQVRTVDNQGQRGGHAWIDYGDYVWEPQYDAYFTKEFYQQQLNLVETARYSLEEALALAEKHNHYGPWKQETKLPSIAEPVPSSDDDLKTQFGTDLPSDLEAEPTDAPDIQIKTLSSGWISVPREKAREVIQSRFDRIRTTEDPQKRAALIDGRYLRGVTTAELLGWPSEKGPKQPHEMTKAEYAEALSQGTVQGFYGAHVALEALEDGNKQLYLEMCYKAHRGFVERARERGETIPGEVLSEYLEPQNEKRTPETVEPTDSVETLLEVAKTLKPEQQYTADYDRTLQFLGIQSSGCRLADAITTGRMRLMLENEEITKGQWEEYLRDLYDMGAIYDESKFPIDVSKETLTEQFSSKTKGEDPDRIAKMMDTTTKFSPIQEFRRSEREQTDTRTAVGESAIGEAAAGSLSIQRQASLEDDELPDQRVAGPSQDASRQVQGRHIRGTYQSEAGFRYAEGTSEQARQKIEATLGTLPQEIQTFAKNNVVFADLAGGVSAEHDLAMWLATARVSGVVAACLDRQNNLSDIYIVDWSQVSPEVLVHELAHAVFNALDTQGRFAVMNRYEPLMHQIMDVIYSSPEISAFFHQFLLPVVDSTASTLSEQIPDVLRLIQNAADKVAELIPDKGQFGPYADRIIQHLLLYLAATSSDKADVLEQTGALAWLENEVFAYDLMVSADRLANVVVELRGNLNRDSEGKLANALSPLLFATQDASRIAAARSKSGKYYAVYKTVDGKTLYSKKAYDTEEQALAMAAALQAVMEKPKEVTPGEKQQKTQTKPARKTKDATQAVGRDRGSSEGREPSDRDTAHAGGKGEISEGAAKPRREVVNARPEIKPPAITRKTQEAFDKIKEVHHALRPHQAEGVQLGIQALQETGAFMCADGPGAGKTRIGLGVAYAAAKEGKAVLVVTENRDILTSAWLSEAEAMGISEDIIAEWKGDDKPQPGKIYVALYSKMRSTVKKKLPLSGWDLVVADECHRLKNTNNSQQAIAGQRLMGNAKQIVFMSATPFDRLNEYWYMGRRLGTFKDERDFDGWLEEMGIQKIQQTIYTKVKNPHTGRLEVTPRTRTVYRRSVSIETYAENLKEMGDKLTAQGLMIKREVAMDGLEVSIHSVDLTDEALEELDKIQTFYTEEYKGDRGAALSVIMQRRFLEKHKIQAAIELAKKELAEGRQVGIFVEYKRESAVARHIYMGGQLVDIDIIAEAESVIKALREGLSEIVPADQIAEIHGGLSGEKALDTEEERQAFQDGKKTVVISTISKGSTGISLHDESGDRPRTQIVVTLPWSGVKQLQVAGRMHRLTSKSNTRLIYIMADHAMEHHLAEILGGKMKILGATVQGDLQKLDLDRGALLADVDETSMQESLETDPDTRAENQVIREEVDEALDEPEDKPEMVKIKVPSSSRGATKSWRKLLTGVDAKQNKGWMYQGDWLNVGKSADVPAGSLILVYDHTGAGKRIHAEVRLVEAMPDGTLKPVADEHGEIKASGAFWADDLIQRVGKALEARGVVSPEAYQRPGPTTLFMPSGGRAPVGGSGTKTTRSSAEQAVMRSEIVDKLRQKLLLPIRTGRFPWRAEGVYKPGQQVVRTKRSLDLQVIAHEVGHHLDALYGLSHPQFDSELLPLGKQTSKRGYTQDMIRQEGLAEFIRLYLTDPQEAQNKAPMFYTEFEINLDAEILDILLETRQMIDTWQNMTPLARVLKSIHKGRKEGKPVTLEGLYTKLVNELYPLYKAVDALTQGQKLRASQDPYATALRGYGWSGYAETCLKHGVLDQNFNKVSDSLQEILAPVRGHLKTLEDYIERLDELRAYALSKRTLELAGKDIPTGIDVEDAKAVVDMFPELEEVVKRLVKFQNAVVEQTLVRSGLVSRKQAEAMFKMHEWFVPLERVFDEFDWIRGGLGAKGFVDLYNPVKRIVGSTKEIYDPLESIIRRVFIYTRLAFQNDVGRQLYELAAATPGSGWVAEIGLPEPKHATTFSLKEIESILKKAGIDTSKVDLNTLATIFRPAVFPPGKENIAAVFIDGERYYMQVEPALYESLKYLDKSSLDFLTKILSVPARVLRAGATLNPAFGAFKNPLTDQISAYLFSNYGYVPGVDFIKGLFHVLKQDDLYWKYMAAGGAQASLVSIDRDYLQGQIMDLLKTEAQKKGYYASHPLEILRAISEWHELATRIGEFAKGTKANPSTEAIIEAVLSAREATVDFARRGSGTQTYRSTVPFAGANIQGIDRLARELGDDEKRKRFLLKVILGIAIPSVLCYLMSRKNKRYQELTHREKDLYFHIPMGSDPNADLLRIPKGREIGVLFGSSFERIMQWIDLNDPRALDGWLESFGGQLIPNLVPHIFLPWMEVKANTRLYTGTPIIPEREKYLPPEMQYAPYTGETARWIGEAFGFSPRIFEHYVQGYLGGLGSLGLDIADFVTRHVFEMETVDEPYQGPSQVPVVGTFFTLPWQSQTLNDFYTTYERLDKDFVRLKELGKPMSSVDRALYSRLKSAMTTLTNINKQRRQIESSSLSAKDKAKRIDQLHSKAVEVAKKALSR